LSNIAVNAMIRVKSKL